MCDWGHIREPRKREGSHQGREYGRKAKSNQDGYLCVPPNEPDFEDIVRQMDNGGNCDATSRGKKIATTGIRRVPSPNPENRVRAEAKHAAKETMMYSMNERSRRSVPTHSFDMTHRTRSGYP